MFEPEPFGRYELLERIAVGGMAEIFRAKSRSLAGFEKVLAIKRLHPRYGEDVDFIKMLIEEARISVRLAHVNIAQIFDLDKIEDHYFIAMEFVDGRDLYRVLRRLNERNRLMPVECAAWIASELCNGLDYAHRKQSEQGTPMAIVHRDISPQNVLLSWEGEIKIVDFGIAKAAQRSFETESGVVKGKFYYMSPEQARGERVDHRSDLFSAGIVLYEMLTGALLYREDDEVTLLSRVRKAEIDPPSNVRPEIPHELERIVLRALQRDVRRRYQTGREFGDALRKFLYSSGLRWNRADLGKLVNSCFDQPYRADPAPTTESTIEDVHGLANLAGGVDPSGAQPAMQSEEYEVDASSMLYRLPPADDDEDDVPTRAHGVDAAAPPPPDPFVSDGSEFTQELSLKDVEVGGVPARTESEEDSTQPLTGGDPEVTNDLDDGLDDELEDELTGIFNGRRPSQPEAPALSGPEPPPPAPPPPDPPPPDLGPTPPPPVVESRVPSQVDLPVAPILAPTAAHPSSRVAQAARAAVDAGEDSLDIPLKSEKTSIGRVDVRSPIGTLDGRQKLAYLAFLLPVVVTGWGISWCNQVIASRPPSVTVSPGAAPAQVEAAAAGVPTGSTPMGVVEILSNPKGAVIEVDGKVLAQRTPTKLNDLRAEEEHRIALTLNNYEPWERRFRLGRNEIRTLQADLSRIEGTLELASRPPGVRVEIDGQPRGETPLEVPGLFIGEEQEVVFRKSGYRPVTKRVEWNGRRFVTLDVGLKRVAGAPVAAAPARTRPAKRSAARPARPRRAAKKRSAGGDTHGYLSVSAIPWGKVYVDRRIYAAETPVLRGRVPAGRHSVKVYYPTLKRFSKAQTVKVRRGETKKLFFRD